MIWIVIGAWIIFSAALVIALCMFSSRCSALEGHKEQPLAERPVRVRSSAPAAGSVR